MDPIETHVFQKLLRVGEVASLLGISPATVYRMTLTRKIPFLKVGGQIRFRKVSLDAWARHREKQPLAR